MMVTPPRGGVVTVELRWEGVNETGGFFHHFAEPRVNRVHSERYVRAEFIPKLPKMIRPNVETDGSTGMPRRGAKQRK